MFQETQDTDYLAVVEDRVQTDYLTWCEQFLDLIVENTGVAGGLSLNDVGCCAGQFYKSLKRRGLPLDYRGFDIEPAYLEIARRIFPELQDAVRILDVERDELPQAEITVVSATLEHLTEPEAAVRRLLDSTSSLALFRTFLGDAPLDQWRQKPQAPKPYRIRQFERAAFVSLLESRGFEAEIVEDRYTRSQPVEIDEGIVRSQFVVAAARRT
jgi:hypothetical protein